MTDKQHRDGLGPTTPESDDEIIFTTPHRRLIAAAGKLAKAEQERLALEYRLRDGRRPQTEDPGVFSADKGRAGLQEPSPCTNTPPP